MTNPIAVSFQPNFIPRRSASFGRYELWFSSFAGAVHLGVGLGLLIKKIVSWVYQQFQSPLLQPPKEADLTCYISKITAVADDIQPEQHLARGAILLAPFIGSLFFFFRDRWALDNRINNYDHLASGIKSTNPRTECLDSWAVAIAYYMLMAEEYEISGQEIRATACRNEAARIGIEVGKELVIQSAYKSAAPYFTFAKDFVPSSELERLEHKIAVQLIASGRLIEGEQGLEAFANAEKTWSEIFASAPQHRFETSSRTISLLEQAVTVLMHSAITISEKDEALAESYFTKAVEWGDKVIEYRAPDPIETMELFADSWHRFSKELSPLASRCFDKALHYWEQAVGYLLQCGESSAKSEEYGWSLEHFQKATEIQNKIRSSMRVRGKGLNRLQGYFSSAAAVHRKAAEVWMKRILMSRSFEEIQNYFIAADTAWRLAGIFLKEEREIFNNDSHLIKEKWCFEMAHLCDKVFHERSQPSEEEDSKAFMEICHKTARLILEGEDRRDYVHKAIGVLWQGAVSEGSTEEAINCHLIAAESYKLVEEWDNAAYCLKMCAFYEKIVGKLDEAKLHYQECLNLYEKTNFEGMIIEIREELYHLSKITLSCRGV